MSWNILQKIFQGNMPTRMKSKKHMKMSLKPIYTLEEHNAAETMATGNMQATLWELVLAAPKNKPIKNSQKYRHQQYSL